MAQIAVKFCLEAHLDIRFQIRFRFNTIRVVKPV